MNTDSFKESVFFNKKEKKSSTLNSVQIAFDHSAWFCDFYTFQHSETKDQSSKTPFLNGNSFYQHQTEIFVPR